MNGKRNLARVAAVALLVGGVATGVQAARAPDKNDKYRTVNITFGTVVSLEDTNLSTDASKGAMVGGVVGVAHAHGRSGETKVASLAAGALLGALLTRAAEGSRHATSVTVKRNDGSLIKVITDHTESLREGDCVSVEEGSYTNVRLVARDMCQSGPHQNDAEVVASHQDDASECDVVKKQLLQAQNQEQFDLASKKVKILCQ